VSEHALPPREGRSPRRLPAPPAVRWIVRTLEDAGYETWTVGGAVRDELLGAIATDWDFATRARPAEVRRLFRRTVPVGVAHGTVGVLARDGTLYEVTTFRRDVETDGRHARVSFSDRIDDDLARRDFTINAVAWHPLREELYDPFGGGADLERGVLRAVGEPTERFAEDHLRILRGIRFAGRFSLEIEGATWQGLTAAVGSLALLSPERVREELLKVLSQDPAPARALDLYRRAGVLPVVLHELGGLPEREWRATLAEVEAVPSHRTWLRVVALLAHLGRVPAADDDPPAVDGLPAADPESARGAARAAALLSRLRASNAQVDRTARLVAGGPLPPPSEAPDADLRRWLATSGPSLLSDRARLWIARCRAGTGPDPLAVLRRLRRIVCDGTPLAVGDLALTGRDLIGLGLEPGPRFGEILDALLAWVLEDPARNTRERLEARVRTHHLEAS
jgi:tRNA nucleotidyltransferase (CCA-adding enzyme)